LKALIPSEPIFWFLICTSLIMAAIAHRRLSKVSNSSTEGSLKESNGRSTDSGGPLDAGMSPRRLERLGQVWWVALVIIFAFALSAALGYQSAQAVTEGKPVECTCFAIRRIGSFSFPWLSGSAGFLGIQTEKGKLEWVDGRTSEKPPGLPDKMVYLGSSSGMVVVYDAKEHRSVRFPIEAVKVTVEPREAILFFELENN
jgi:hypothetical protein